MLGSIVTLSPVHAGSEIESLIKMLHENGTVSDEQYQRLVAELEQNQLQVQQEKQQLAEQIAETQSPNDVQVSIKGGGLNLQTRDGQFTTRLGGRLQLDTASYSGKPEMGDGTEVRRAYLTLQGTMYNDWGYRFQYNFASTGADGKGILDAYIDYTGFDALNLRVGNFKKPFSLHEAVSDNYTTFTERALPAVFSPGRRLGVMASQEEKDWTWAIGAFGDKVEAKGGQNDEEWGWGARATMAPINQDGKLVHLGLSTNYRDTADAGTVRFKSAAETHVSVVNLVDTGDITDTENVWKHGLELATVLGPFAAQAEYITSHVQRDNADDLDFDSWYAEMSYFLTGESRPYKKGKFAGPKPKTTVGQSGIGAWQLALRYSTLDLSDHELDGGEMDAMTLGLNWFPTPTLRFSANYVDVLDVDGGSQDGNEPSVVQLRSQWAF
jgi:phosphate-selective porin OprO/OprP